MTFWAGRLRADASGKRLGPAGQRHLSSARWSWAPQWPLWCFQRKSLLAISNWSSYSPSKLGLSCSAPLRSAPLLLGFHLFQRGKTNCPEAGGICTSVLRILPTPPTGLQHWLPSASSRAIIRAPLRGISPCGLWDAKGGQPEGEGKLTTGRGCPGSWSLFPCLKITSNLVAGLLSWSWLFQWMKGSEMSCCLALVAWLWEV